MPDLIFSFDSEDYLTLQAADAELWWAAELSKRSFRGSWQLVGEFVRALKRWGREDVIAAIAKHEIGYHTNYHSLYPTHPEAVEKLNLADGIRYITGVEAPGVSTLATTFNTWPVSYCSAGDSWTPSTLLALSRMGIKVFCNDKIQKPTSVPYWYCGMLVAKYAFDFQRYYEESGYRPGAFEEAFEALVAQTPRDGVIVLYTHPTRMVTAKFWDEVFANGKRPALKDCPPAPLRTPKEIETIKTRCGQMLDWLRARKDLRVIDFAQMYRERAAQRRDLQSLLNECSLQPGEEGQLPLRESGAEAFMPSSTFDTMNYRWVPYTPGFEGKSILKQAAQLAWTASPAQLNPTK